ncbi:ABC transporter permease [Gorillibacterium sp. CAU 1737]|uniref:ABC transporter permease n=1 Tax=Gorillibacterium sp. CAU 1737 TaxID=3140362 RepID=UPI00326169B0
MNLVTLVGKEIKMVGRNLVFYLLIAIILLFFYSNYATQESWDSGKAPIPPQKIEETTGSGTTGAPAGNGQPDAPPSGESGATAAPDGANSEDPEEAAPPPRPAYGFKAVADPKGLAERYQLALEWDLENGAIDQRVFFGMFAHQSKLSESDKKAMKEAIASFQEILKAPESHTSEEVKQVAADLDHKLGGWTNYMRDGMSFAAPIMTYEEAMEQFKYEEAEYLKRVNDGEVYTGMARLFCDYMGITAGIFPVFLAAFALGRDRTSRMHELIASRRVRAWTYVGARFAAHALLISLIYLLLSVLAAWETAAALEGEGAFWKALPIFLQYGAGWLLPTVWATTAFGMLVYALFGNGLVAIPLQIAWWLASALPLMGDYRLFKLFIRFNTPTEAETYHHFAGQILANRIFYVLFAFLMVEAAALLWERRRSSGVSGKRRFRRHQAAPTIQGGSR